MGSHQEEDDDEYETVYANVLRWTNKRGWYGFYIFCGTQKQNESQLEVGLTGDMRFTVDVGNNSQSQNSQFAYKLNNIHKVREYGVSSV